MYKNTINLGLKLTIDQMLMSNVHLGHTKKFLNVHIKPYLLGSRNNIYILNVVHTAVQFKLIINIIINLISLRQKLLIIKERDVFNFRKLLNVKHTFYSDKKWIGGSLTNFRRVRKSRKFKDDNNSFNSLGCMRYMPSLVFFFDVDLSRWSLIEAANLEIPIASIIDSSSSLYNHVNYPIIGNNKAFESLFLYLSLIINSVTRGHQKELLKILRLV